MQRKVLLAALVALVALGGCAQRDPNLLVRGLDGYGRAPGDYTLTLKTYVLDAEGHAKLAGTEDASLRGFVTRTLAEKGYTLKASGPARYALEAHLLCADTRRAKLGVMAEELRLPADAVGAGYSEDIHYWLPDRNTDLNPQGLESADRQAVGRPRPSHGSSVRSNDTHLGATPLGSTEPAFCQGRVLVTLTPAGAGAKREVFVGRMATGDCAATPDCPVNTCRQALEQALVYELESRF